MNRAARIALFPMFPLNVIATACLALWLIYGQWSYLGISLLFTLPGVVVATISVVREWRSRPTNGSLRDSP